MTSSIHKPIGLEIFFVLLVDASWKTSWQVLGNVKMGKKRKYFPEILEIKPSTDDRKVDPPKGKLVPPVPVNLTVF